MTTSNRAKAATTMQAVLDSFARDHLLWIRLIVVCGTTVVVAVAWWRRRRASDNGWTVSARMLGITLLAMSAWSLQHIILVAEWWRDSVAWFDAVTILGALSVGPLAAVILAMAVSVLRHE